MSIFTGSAVAIITPFNEKGVNYDVLGDLIEFQVQNKTDAIVICGTTGESATLSDDEQIECIRYTVNKVNKRIPVIAGTGSNNTEHSIKLTKKAYELGVDGTLVVTPYYNKTTQKGLKEHYEMIAKVADVPMILYNVPSRTGLNIIPKTVNELSKIENIVAVKEASGNISQIAEIMALCGDKIDVYSGNDDQIVPILSLGGKGVISVLANVMPEQTHNIVQYYLEGKAEESRKLQLELLKLINLLFVEVNPIPVKTAVGLMGYNVGECRKPLTTMDIKNLELLKQELQKNKLI